MALVAFYEAESFEDAIRSAVSLGGDSDTIAAVTGGIAEAYYGIPDPIRKIALTFLDGEMRSAVLRFTEQVQNYADSIGLLKNNVIESKQKD